jgi:hypothetical protein
LALPPTPTSPQQAADIHCSYLENVSMKIFASTISIPHSFILNLAKDFEKSASASLEPCHAAFSSRRMAINVRINH